MNAATMLGGSCREESTSSNNRPGVRWPLNVLYRFWRDDLLLYIGITNQGARRLWQHADTSPWWHLATNVTIEHLNCSREELEHAERKAIASELPLFNVKHNPRAEIAIELRAAAMSECEYTPHRKMFRCQAITNAGRPCANAAQIGFTTCTNHRHREVPE